VWDTPGGAADGGGPLPTGRLSPLKGGQSPVGVTR